MRKSSFNAIDSSVVSLGRSYWSQNGREKAPHSHDPDVLVYKWCEGSCSNRNWWTEVPIQLLLRSCHHARSVQAAVLSRWIWSCFMWLARGKTLLRKAVPSGHTWHKWFKHPTRDCICYLWIHFVAGTPGAGCVGLPAYCQGVSITLSSYWVGVMVQAPAPCPMPVEPLTHDRWSGWCVATHSFDWGGPTSRKSSSESHTYFTPLDLRIHSIASAKALKMAGAEARPKGSLQST